VLQILKNAFKGFGKDECGTRAAALAYSTIFALPPLLILLVTIAGKVWGPEAVQGAIEHQFSGLIGQSAAQQVHEMVVRGQHSAGRGALATILGLLGLILGATGAFLSLQDALNHAWEVKPDPKQGGIKNFIMKRLLSLGMVVGLGFLVAVSLALSAAIAAVGGSFGTLPQPVLFTLDLLLSLVVLGGLFAAMFKFLPDAKVAWRDVLVGGLATAVLFILGKFVIGLYLGHSSPGNAFGAASAFAVILVWIYYAGMIVLFGAEFTQEWAIAKGQGVVPKEGAVHVVQREERGVANTPGGLQPALANRGASGERRATRGGVGSDWLIGLPALYFLFKRRANSGK
jgi:membrane protein